jgi:hypothetical protein
LTSPSSSTRPRGFGTGRGSRRWSYLPAVEAQGLQVEEVRKSDYRVISERALEACGTYEVESISLVAVKTR